MSSAVRPVPAAVTPPPARPVFVPKPYRWTVDDFYDMGNVGIAAGKKLLLIDGEILEMPAPDPDHDICLSLADYWCKSAFAVGYVVRIQMGMTLGINTDPIPDVAVVPGSPRDYHRHPSTATLVVEVANSSHSYDTVEKASLYAAAGVPDYWVINVVDRRLLVFRDPRPDPAQKYAHGYATQTTHGPADRVFPLAASHAAVTVSELLP